MCLKITLYLAFMCAVNASVIVNVFEIDDDALADGNEEYSEERSLQSCDSADCRSNCIIHGFPRGGYCYFDRCICWMFNADHSNDIARSCNRLSCAKHCRRTGHEKGTCVNDQCKCRHFSALTDFVRDCNRRDCAETCRKSGDEGSSCIDGECKCNNFLTKLIVDNSNDIESCEPLACDQLCRRIGRQGGVCVKGTCKCDIFQPLTENSISFEGVGGCNPVTCQQTCRSLEYKDGNCSSANKCLCAKATEHKADNVSEPQACSSTPCNQMCHRMGYNGGDCVGDKCKCRIVITKEIEVPLDNVEKKKNEPHGDKYDIGEKGDGSP